MRACVRKCICVCVCVSVCVCQGVSRLQTSFTRLFSPPHRGPGEVGPRGDPSTSPSPVVTPLVRRWTWLMGTQRSTTPVFFVTTAWLQYGPGRGRRDDLNTPASSEHEGRSSSPSQTRGLLLRGSDTVEALHPTHGCRRRCGPGCVWDPQKRSRGY